MRPTVIAFLAAVALAGCGGTADGAAPGALEAPPRLAPAPLTSVTWGVSSGAVTCPGSSARDESVADGPGHVVFCTWACGAYQPAKAGAAAVIGREVRLAIAYLWDYGAGSWAWQLNWEQYDAPGTCLP